MQRDLWPKRHRRRGSRRPRTTLKLDEEYRDSVRDYAEQQSELVGYKVSKETIIQELTTRNSRRYNKARRELRQLYAERLAKEQRLKTSSTPTTTSPELTGAL
jgi:hypothetical protein